MPKSITICGSMQFADRMIELGKILEEIGYKVYLPDVSERSTEAQIPSSALQSSAKRAYIAQHFEKIRLSDAVLIANYEKNGVPGYVGSNTLMEVGVAHFLGKKIYLLFPPGEQSCREEVLALATEVLDGSNEKLSSVRSYT